MGTPAPTTHFFQVPTRAKSIVYVIDRSASMGLGTLAAAERELLASVDCLPFGARFQVVFYNRSAEPVRLDGRVDLLPATIENKRRVALYVDSLIAEGGTDHVGALKRALLFRPEVVFFLTDANDLAQDQVRAITVLNAGRACIHAIELTASRHIRENASLQALARANRGTYRAVCIDTGQ